MPLVEPLWLILYLGPNVVANPEARAKRQARTDESVPRTTEPGLVARR